MELIRDLKNGNYVLGSARFNNDSYKENVMWKNRKKWNGAVYGFDKKVPKNIPSEKILVVLDMNNDVNQIEGIGLIRNILIPKNRSRIYKNENYNRYVYKSHYYIFRNEILKRVDGEEVMLLLEKILFTGSRHFKRGHGFLSLSNDRINSSFKEKKRRVYLCSVCGLPKKNHICKKTRVQKYIKTSLDFKCSVCGQTKKGHICGSLKKNTDRERKVHLFLRDLFD